MNLKSLAVVVSCMCCLSVPVQANAAEKETVAVNAVSTGEVEPLALVRRITANQLYFYRSNTNLN